MLDKIDLYDSHKYPFLKPYVGYTCCAEASSMYECTTLVLISPDAWKLIREHGVSEYYDLCREFGEYHTGIDFTYVVCEATDDFVAFLNLDC